MRGRLTKTNMRVMATAPTPVHHQVGASQGTGSHSAHQKQISPK